MSIHNKIMIAIGNETPQLLNPFGRTYEYSFNKVSREEQAADGSIREDVRAIKRTHILKWDMTERDVIERLESVLLYARPVTLYIEPAGGGTFKQYKVIMRPFRYKRLLAVGTWLYSDVSVEFNEV